MGEGQSGAAHLIRPLRRIADFVDGAPPGSCQWVFRVAVAMEAVASWIVAVVAGIREADGDEPPYVELDSLDPTFATWERAIRGVGLRTAGHPDLARLEGLVDAWVDVAATETVVPGATGAGALRCDLRGIRNHLAHTMADGAIDAAALAEGWQGLLLRAAEAFAGADLVAVADGVALVLPSDTSQALRPPTDADALDPPVDGDGLWLRWADRWSRIWPLHRATADGAATVEEVFIRWSRDDPGPRYLPLAMDVAVSFGGRPEIDALHHRHVPARGWFDDDVSAAADSCIGRRDVVAALVAATTGPDGGTAGARQRVVAPMGAGKTTVVCAAARRIALGGREVVTHLFMENDPRCSFEAFVDHVLDHFDVAPEQRAGDPLARRRAASAAARDAGAVIVCDGLDELAHRDPAGLAELGTWVHTTKGCDWILSGRPDQAVADASRGFRLVEVPPLAPAEMELVLWTRGPELVVDAIWQHRTTDDADAFSAFVDTLVARSEGNPQFLVFALKQLAGDPLDEVHRKVADPSWVPTGLAALVTDAIERAGVGDEGPLRTGLLCLLVSANEPLTAAQLAALWTANQRRPVAVEARRLRRALLGLSGMVRSDTTPEGGSAWTTTHASIRAVITQGIGGERLALGLREADERLRAAAADQIVDHLAGRADDAAPCAAHLFRHGIDYLTRTGADGEPAAEADVATAVDGLCSDAWLGARLDAPNPATIDQVIVELAGRCQTGADDVGGVVGARRDLILGIAHQLRRVPNGLSVRRFLEQVAITDGRLARSDGAFHPLTLSSARRDSRRRMVRLDGHTEAIVDALVVDPTTLITSGRDGRTIAWDLETGRARSTMVGPSAGLLSPPRALLVDPETVVTWCRISPAALVWDLPSGRLRRVLDHNTKSVTDTAVLGPGGLVTTSIDGAARVWDLATGEPTSTLEHHDALSGVHVADESTLVLWSSCDVLVWKVGSAGPPDRRTAHSSAVRSCVRLDRGRAATWAEGEVVVWDLVRRRADHVMQTPGATRGAAAIDATAVMSWTSDAATVWNVDTGMARHALGGHRSPIQGALVADPRTVVTWSQDESIVWDVPTGRLLHTVVPGGPIAAVALPGRSAIAVATRSGTIDVRDLRDGTQRTTVHDVAEAVGPVVAPSATSVVVCSAGRRATVVELSDAGASGPATARAAHPAAFLAQDTVVAWAGADLRVWDLAARHPLSVTAPEPIRDVLPAGRAQLLAWGAGGATWWDLARGVRHELRSAHTSEVHGAVILGAASAATWSEAEAVVWDAASGQPQTTVSGHDDTIAGVVALGAERVAAFSVDRITVAHPVSGHMLVLTGDEALGESELYSDPRIWVGGLVPVGDHHLVIHCLPAPKVWNQDTSEVTTLAGHEGPVDGIVSVGARSLLSHAAHCAIVWDVPTGEERWRLTFDGEIQGCAQVAPGVIVTPLRDGTALKWDLFGSDQPIRLQGHAGVISDVLSLDRRTFATRAPDGVIVWDLQSGRAEARLPSERVAAWTVGPGGLSVAESGPSDVVPTVYRWRGRSA